MLAVDRLKKTISPYPFVACLGRDRLALERRAVPVGEVGGGVVGRLEEARQRRFRIGRGADRLIGQDEFAERLVEAREPRRR